MIILVVVGVNFRGVDAGHKGVILNGPGGPSRTEIDEGWHWDPAFMLSNIRIVRWNTQVRDMSGASGLTVRSSDNLNIQMDISVVYHLQPDKVADILIDNGDYVELLDRYVRNVPRNVASNFTGEYIGGIGRVVVEEEIQRSMANELAVYSIILEDVLLRSVDLPDTVDIAIEEKLAAQQKVVTAELQRQATVIQALANADVIRILAEGQRNATIIQAKRDRRVDPHRHRPAPDLGPGPDERDVGVPSDALHPGPHRPGLERVVRDHSRRRSSDHRPAETVGAVRAGARPDASSPKAKVG